MEEKWNNPVFEKSSVSKEGWINDQLPEILFWGKSNVGKSSLINSLLNSKKIVKVSQTPGKTKTLNFFNINNKFRVVDAPGFGYAKVPLALRNKFQKFIWEYIEQRTNCVVVCFLIDSRHGPSEKDIEIIKRLLFLNKNILVVATKYDKLSQKDKSSLIKIFKTKLNFDKKDFILVSSLNNHNIWKIKKIINHFITKKWYNTNM